VTHYTLQGKACEKEYEQKCSDSFCDFAAGQTCFMEGTRSASFVYSGSKFLPDYTPGTIAPVR
ncbi:MAG: hypothetical protein IJW92_08615, partial [Clostridia bacterium]|nr:hypothetical protein [Clostridia bacterium]